MADGSHTAPNATTERIVQLEEYLRHRADSAGNPRAGYKANVQAIKLELARLRATPEPTPPPTPQGDSG